MKIGLSTEAFRSYVPIIQQEVETYIKRSAAFKGKGGTVNIPAILAEITIYTASHSLQGKDVRDKFDSTLASLYHDLDMGFSPINFMLHWAPLPHNRARDYAQRTVAQTYMNIIQERRNNQEEAKLDIMSQLMSSTYKDGTPVPDQEIAHMMIALLMAGQHSSSSTISWIMLRLASRPDLIEELYQEQIQVLGSDLPALEYEDLSKLTLHQKRAEGGAAPAHAHPLDHAQGDVADARGWYQVRDPVVARPHVLARLQLPRRRLLPQPDALGPAPVGRGLGGRDRHGNRGGEGGLWVRAHLQGRIIALPAFWRRPASLHRRAVRHGAAGDHHGDHGAAVQVEESQW